VYSLDALVRSFSLSSFGRSQGFPLARTPIDARPRSRAAGSNLLRVSDATQRLAAGVRNTAEFRRKVASPCCFLLTAMVVLFTPAQGELSWRKVHGPDLRALLVDHELADGVHYAYQFRSDGTLTGFNMGKAIRGTWRIASDEFCWTQARRAAAEECFDVERSGNSIRLLHDGYEAFSAALTPVKRPSREGSPQ